VSDVVEKLIQMMQDELQCHSDLAAVLENKLDAMRHYDISRLESLTTNEQRITEVISLNGKKRYDVVRQASVEFFPNRGGRVATAKELADVLDEPSRGRLLALAAMLHEVTERVRRLNRINSVATQKIMGHFDHIFRIIAQSGRDIGLYGRAGKKSLLEQNRLVDAFA